MPKLRKLSGIDVVRILTALGFVDVRGRGSHRVLRRTVKVAKDEGNEVEEVQTITLPGRDTKPLAPRVLKRLYEDLQRFCSEADLKPHFLGEDAPPSADVPADKPSSDKVPSDKVSSEDKGIYF